MDFWPPEVREFVLEFGRAIKSDLRAREELFGKSGAFVATVDVTGKYDGLFVLKIAQKPSDGRDEADVFRQVIADHAFDGHYPQLIRSYSSRGLVGLLMETSGNSILECRPLVESPALFTAAYERLVEVLWQPATFTFADKATSLDELITSTLGSKIDRGRGRILNNAARLSGEDILTSSHIAFEEALLTNPISIASSGGLSACRIRPLIGPTHGDCHAGNVFIRATIDGRVRDLYLIDFGTYQSRALIFFDFAYFELSTLLRQFEMLGEGSWLELLRVLQFEQQATSLRPDEKGWAEAIRGGRRALYARVKSQFQTRYDDLVRQQYLAAAIAGLAFLNKPERTKGSFGISADQYVKALAWSAYYLDRLCKVSRVSIPQVGNVPRVGRHAIGAVVASHKRRVSPNYDSTTFNILVLSEAARSAPSVAELLGSEWKVVIDFGVRPLAEATLTTAASMRQSWPGHPFDLRVLSRGSLWFFANGRYDLSDAPPAASAADWLRRYQRALQDLLSSIAVELAPALVRVLAVLDGQEVSRARLIIEALDSAFGDKIASIVVTGQQRVDAAVDHSKISYDETLVVADDVAAHRAARVSQETTLLIPHRRDADVLLQAVPFETIARVEKDLLVVGASLAQQLPIGREFGTDFRRGMKVEWAELAQNLDVPRRTAQDRVTDQLRRLLSQSTNAHVNLLHEPSAGGSTLARRIAWDIKEQAPVVVLEQASSDTAGYIREVFQLTNLAPLVLIEADVLTESGRESLLQQLREDNTRAVFLWVSRTYESNPGEEVLRGRLSEVEATAFLDAYLAQVEDFDRREGLRALATQSSLEEQRSPFFFGLFAFGEEFVGLPTMVENATRLLSNDAKDLLASVALVTLYSGPGFPLPELHELGQACDDLFRVLTPPFAVSADDSVRLAHVLIARKTLELLARNRDEWRADLFLFADRLLKQLRRLRNRDSQRVIQLMETVFLTRDTPRALADDATVRAGGFAHSRRFSPLIHDLQNAATARRILETVWTLWPTQPHAAVHFARHLLYEAPSEVDRAIRVAEAADAGAATHEPSVTHVVGTCYRIRMERRLEDAIANERDPDTIAETVRADFLAATDKFDKALRLERSEYGHLSSIQTTLTLINSMQRLAKCRTVADLIASRRFPWIDSALSRAEEHVTSLRDMPSRKLSTRAKRVVAEWSAVYGNIDEVVSRLRALAKRYEDTEIRRALYYALLSKHRRDWRTIPQGTLSEIVELTERNVVVQGVRDADVRTWLRAYRRLRQFDVDRAVIRLSDWSQLRPDAAEPAFYLAVLYFIKWLNAGREIREYAAESSRWMAIASRNRDVGYRGWGYEWLVCSEGRFGSVHFDEFDVDPAATVRFGTEKDRSLLESVLVRVAGVISDYRGPTEARLDLGGGIKLRVVPRETIHKDDEGKAATAFVSFAYDGFVGWDIELNNPGRSPAKNVA